MSAQDLIPDTTPDRLVAIVGMAGRFPGAVDEHAGCAGERGIQ